MASPRHVWNSIWFALRRSRKDRRARQAILGALVSGLVVVGYVVRLVYLTPIDAIPHERWALAFYAFLGVTGGAAFLIIRGVRQKSDTAPLSIRTSAVSAPADSRAIREYLEERLIIVASLVLRAASERYVRQHDLPAGTEVITRQVHNRVLRERKVWEKLEPEERELIIVADGAWTDEQMNGAVQWCEQLRLLRWVLRIDEQIVPLAHFPLVDAALSREALERKAPGAPMLGAWEVRPERAVALAYAARAFAELRARGSAGGEATAWAETLRTQSLGDSTDLVVQARTVADLEDSELRLLTAIAAARERYASWLVEILGADTPVPFSIWPAR